jgi:hypothetical protein
VRSRGGLCAWFPAPRAKARPHQSLFFGCQGVPQNSG